MRHTGAEHKGGEGRVGRVADFATSIMKHRCSPVPRCVQIMRRNERTFRLTRKDSARFRSSVAVGNEDVVTGQEQWPLFGRHFSDLRQVVIRITKASKA